MAKAFLLYVMKDVEWLFSGFGDVKDEKAAEAYALADRGGDKFSGEVIRTLLTEARLCHLLVSGSWL